MSLFQVTKKQVIENYELRTMTGDIVSFTPSYSQLLPDPFSDLNVKCSIVATQSGSGTPYPPGGGKNKFDKETVNHGYLINGMGNYVSYPDTNVSDYTPVVEGVGYYLYGLTKHPNTFQDNFELFDSSKTKVGYANVRTNEYPYTIPSGVKFVRFTVHDDDLNTAMFATSEGEYEPYSNIRPISGYTEANITACGINLWDEEWTLGSLDINGDEVPSNTAIRSKNFIPVTPSTSFYMLIGETKDHVICYYDHEQNFINRMITNSAGHSFTTPSNCFYIKLRFDSITTYSGGYSVNYPSTDTDYHAYNGQTYTVNFGQTVYGGVLDVTRGKLTVTHGCIVLDGTQEVWISNWRPQPNSVGWYYHYDLTINKIMEPNEVPDMLCNVSTAQTYNNMYNNDIAGVCCYTSNYAGLFVRVADTSLTTPTAINAYLANNPMTITYPLATPFDIDLTPEVISAIVGENNVFADCGDVTVKCLI